MEVLNTYFVYHTVYLMGKNYRTLRKVYKSFEGEYVMEIQGKVITYARITEEEFVEWRVAFKDAAFLIPYEK